MTWDHDDYLRPGPYPEQDPITLRIQVTQEHIDCGVREDSNSCPIALAIKAQVPDVHTPTVDVDQADISFYRGGVLYRYATPELAAEFVEMFDSDDRGSAWDCWEADVGPFEFELANPVVVVP